jgi:hypothetical protein
MIRIMLHFAGIIAVSFLAFTVYVGPMLGRPIQPFEGTRLFLLVALTMVALAGHFSGARRALSGPTVEKPAATPACHHERASDGDPCWRCGEVDPSYFEEDRTDDR